MKSDIKNKLDFYSYYFINKLVNNFNDLRDEEVGREEGRFQSMLICYESYLLKEKFYIFFQGFFIQFIYNLY